MLTKIKTELLRFFSNSKNSNDQNSKEHFDTLKITLLGLAFFFIIGSYSVLRPLKSSVFLAIVGKEYIPLAKMLSMAFFLPAVLFYAKLVDKLRQSQVVYFFLILYAILGVFFAIILSHPTMGLSNTYTSAYRIAGWAFYLYLDMFSSLVVSTFWAFANSINTPEYAQKNYGKIVAFSRVGGILTPSLSWLIMQKVQIAGTISIPILIVATSIFLIVATFCVAKIIKKIPHKLLHGYQAAYIVDKKLTKTKVGLFQGLTLMVTKPYVLGIFGITYLFEVISVILDYQMQVLMSIANNNAVIGMSSFMFLYTAIFQALGLIFALFGTSTLLKWLGVNKCLLIMPISCFFLMLILLVYPSLASIFITLVLLRALNYGFNAPVKEILYIPTTKDIKFKSKSWIESFGRSLSKTSGSAVNLLAHAKESINIIKVDSIYAMGFSFIWAIIAVFLGKKYDKVIKDNQVIGNQDI